MKQSFLIKHKKIVAWMLIGLGVIFFLGKYDIENLTVYKALDTFWPFILIILGLYLL